MLIPPAPRLGGVSQPCHWFPSALHRHQPGDALDAIHVRHGDVHGHHIRISPLEQIESLKERTFGGTNKEALREEEARLKRIREVSADFLAALKNDQT